MTGQTIYTPFSWLCTICTIRIKAHQKCTGATSESHEGSSEQKQFRRGGFFETDDQPGQSQITDKALYKVEAGC